MQKVKRGGNYAVFSFSGKEIFITYIYEVLTLGIYKKKVLHYVTTLSASQTHTSNSAKKKCAKKSAPLSHLSLSLRLIPLTTPCVCVCLLCI